MKTVNIGELKNQLSCYLQYVKNGEEIVIRDRSVPVARILPFRHGADCRLAQGRGSPLKAVD
jgi:prevent-host-death family protein